MTEQDFEVVCSKIDEESEFLNSISQDIWKMPEIMFKEVQAHALLTCALKRRGFSVHKHYFMPTAFRAEFCPKKNVGPTVAIILEYDALPEIGHACGHNLIAEAGLAAAIAIKAAMEADVTLLGKLVVLGTPAEEGGGGKIRLLELGAFDGIDIALMVHPARITQFFPVHLCNIKYSVEYKGREAHAAACPWGGLNALDAAVSCYQSIAFLRQHMKPRSCIQTIITHGGVVTNVIPAEARMQIQVRATTKGELRQLRDRVEECMRAAAEATGCAADIHCDEANYYENVIVNKVLGELFAEYATRLGLGVDPAQPKRLGHGSTDMGNVSHVVPSIHVLYAISTESVNHTKGFAAASGSLAAQAPTLMAAKAMAMTALSVMRSPETLQEVKRQFHLDVLEDSKY